MYVLIDRLQIYRVNISISVGYFQYGVQGEVAIPIVCPAMLSLQCSFQRGRGREERGREGEEGKQRGKEVKRERGKEGERQRGRDVEKERV